MALRELNKFGFPSPIDDLLAFTISFLLRIKSQALCIENRKGILTLKSVLDLVVRLFLAISQSSFICSAGTTSSCRPLNIRIGVVTGIFGSLFADSHF